MVRVGTRAWYAYGASSTDRRDVRGSNACQWAMIREALAAGCDGYSLRGITPTLDAGDPHAGLIRFKVGTGGEAVRYVGEWDLPLRPLLHRAFTRYLARREARRRR
jgi:lipid II:glycine glycyltransferase (peptidoglycan interpeptide bridge formation enzyme)